MSSSHTSHLRRRLAARLARCFAVLSLAAVAMATPYAPTDDDEVLVTLPQAVLASRGELATLRRQLAEDPESAQLAGDVASRYLALGKQEGDPRYYGYAQAALQPWWEAPSAPPEILRLRSKLKERDHRYDAALEDLQLLLEQDPRNLQAWIEVSNIHRVQGDYDAAPADAEKLGQFAGPIPMLLCRVPILAATGHAEEAKTMLDEATPKLRADWPGLVPWAVTMQTEIALALGREEQAEEHFLAGLSAEPNDYYLMRSYADLLLDQDRPAEALSLLRDHTSDNGVLLRAAIAAKRAGETGLAAKWREQLASRFEEIRLRGSEPHGRFEARYELELNDDPARALGLALANWRKQKEVPDTRNVLEAAIGADDPAAAQEAVDFLEANATENAVLERLVQRLEANE